MFVFLILGFFLIEIYGNGQVKLTNQNTLLVRRTQEELRKYSITYGEKKIIFKYPHASQTISIEMKHTDDIKQSVCQPIQRDILFGDYEKGLQTNLLKQKEFSEDDEPNFNDDPNFNDPSYFLTSPLLLNMVHLPKGVAVVSSDNQLFIIDIHQDNTINSGYKFQVQQTINFGQLRESNEFEIPQMVYSPSFEYLYLVYNSQVLGVKITNLEFNQQTLALKNINVLGRNINNPHDFVGTIKYVRGHLFVPLGSIGLDMYEIQQNGDLLFKKNMQAQQLYGDINKKIYIIDLALGGQTAQHLYVLDRINGVIVLEFDENYDLKLNNNMGTIDIQGGLVIKEWNSTNLFVLVDGDITSQVKEYGINTNKNEWFLMRTHYLFGHYFGIEITNKFAILRAVDAHRIIYHSIWEGFQMTYEEDEENYDLTVSKLDEEYLILPALQQLNFYSDNYGEGNPNTWHFNQSHKFIMGITKHNLIQIPYYIMHPIVECFTDDRLIIGKSLKYQLKVNTTDCKIKNTIDIQKENFYTSMCQYIENMEVKIEYDGSFSIFTVEELLSIIIGLVMLLIIAAIALAYCFSNYQKKRNEISLEISGFESKGYNINDRTTKLTTQYP